MRSDFRRFRPISPHFAAPTQHQPRGNIETSLAGGYTTWQDAGVLTDVVAVLLAAGGGSRFEGDGHKLAGSLPATGRRPVESVAERSLANLLDADFETVCVVTGRLGADELGVDRITAAVPSVHVEVLHNPNWRDGQATSVSLGIAAARRAGATVAVIGLADQPGIDPSAWRNVAAAALEGAPIAVATYDGRRANPVALRHETWSTLPTSGDRGARALMRVRPDLVVEVSCPGSPHDIDTVEDLRRWQSN